ncbi:uncharacterized protein LTR77_000441 [Saxophila tyrrhenica]|uniref:AB hydrolase-1 domain-containing protein n=1 Tax=Saxophila tyrrhenica TaxID=1690608 RepID=A0AAV9PSG0_9PEZI|nr:hypothetical protein LTR77_000441 [Saxophila tyrrhenica]
MNPLIATFLTFGLTAASYSCIDFDVPLTFNASYFPPSFPKFENHYQSAAFLTGLTARNAADGPSPIGDAVNTTVEATIAAHYCTPDGAKPTTVQILTHGLGFDHSYWHFGGHGSKYNYVKVATAAGYATLSYDRLGNGKSSIGGPYTIQQLGPETGVLVALTTLLREGGLSKPAGKKIAVPKKVVHVGHSFGSAITNVLAAIAPTLSDTIVLTGYSTDLTYSINFAAATSFHLAIENQPKRFAAYKNKGWITWADELVNQYGFFHYPAFDPEVLATAEATKFPFAIMELITNSPTKAPAWTGPALLITGEYDEIFCGSWCHGVLHKAKPYFKNASPFETYIQPDTGHGMNLHHNATGFFNVVNNFLDENVGA